MATVPFKEPAILYCDFEFNQITNEKVNLVSCVTRHSITKKIRKFWLHNDNISKKQLKKHFKNHDGIIIGYACVAEARSVYSLGINPLDLQWIDLFLEYRMMTNHNDKLNWGKQLVDGKVKTFSKPVPKWERVEETKASGFSPTHSLAEATFKLTGEIRDTKEKDETRALIISNPPKFTMAEKKRILDYNTEDVIFLERIWEELKNQYALVMPPQDLNWEHYYEDALWRGRYAAHTAIMESVGYPINLEATKNFSKQLSSILTDCQRDINSQFKDEFIARGMANILKGVPKEKEMLPFKWDAKKKLYTWNQKVTREWIEENADVHSWLKTEKGALSLSLEAFEKQFHFKHDYPRGNFGAQMVRFLKLKQSLYGFASADGKKKKTFWDSVGPDGRVRPYMNIYGAQSGRSQPAATGFMFLKPAWMRALVEPAKGKFLAGIDYGQQEFFIAALLSYDQNMIDAYLSGDPYLYMGKKAGAIPEDGTKKTHERERDLMKNTTLGILFNMTKYGLSIKLTNDTGREYTKEDAQELIDTFESLYPDFTEYRKNIEWHYEQGNPIITLDGWTMWTDNDNPRSVTNVPIQSGGSAIMRKAVDLAVEKGVKVIFTLHDAIYIEGDVGNEKRDILKLRDAMRDAFAFFFEGGPYEEISKKIKLDPKAWGRHFPEKGEIKAKDLVIPVSSIYLDSRAINDYNKFSPYFNESDADSL